MIRIKYKQEKEGMAVEASTKLLERQDIKA